jgi:hypothetical protein
MQRRVLRRIESVTLEIRGKFSGYDIQTVKLFCYLVTLCTQREIQVNRNKSICRGYENGVDIDLQSVKW